MITGLISYYTRSRLNLFCQLLSDKLRIFLLFCDLGRGGALGCFLLLLLCFSADPGPCYSKCDPRTAIICITWELGEMHNARPHSTAPERDSAFQQGAPVCFGTANLIGQDYLFPFFTHSLANSNQELSDFFSPTCDLLIQVVNDR